MTLKTIIEKVTMIAGVAFMGVMTYNAILMIRLNKHRLKEIAEAKKN